MFGLQAFGWLVQMVFATFFVLYASSYSERWGELALLVFQVVIALALIATFIAGLLRPMGGSAARRFAVTHWIAGGLAFAPAVVGGVVQVVQRAGDARWGDAASDAAVVLALVALPIAGIVAARRETPALVVASAVGGLLCVLVGALVFLGIGVGMAGISA